MLFFHLGGGGGHFQKQKLKLQTKAKTKNAMTYQWVEKTFSTIMILESENMLTHGRHFFLFRKRRTACAELDCQDNM
jgi:hypothetical protein